MEQIRVRGFSGLGKVFFSLVILLVHIGSCPDVVIKSEIIGAFKLGINKMGFGLVKNLCLIGCKPLFYMGRKNLGRGRPDLSPCAQCQNQEHEPNPGNFLSYGQYHFQEQEQYTGE